MMRNTLILTSIACVCLSAEALAANEVQVNTDATRQATRAAAINSLVKPGDDGTAPVKAKRAKKQKGVKAARSANPEKSAETVPTAAEAAGSADKVETTSAAGKSDERQAGESKPGESKPGDNKAGDNKAADGTKAASTKSSSKNFVSSVGSFVAGTFVGVPVQMFRKSKAETKVATRDLVGETNNKFKLGAAGILGVPAGILSGVIQGVVYGPLDAYRGTKQEPFSPEAFSLGDSK